MVKRVGTPQVIVQSKTVYEKGMPFPVVHYPSHYGIFICFSREHDDKDIYFCSCITDIVENAVRMDYELGKYLARAIVINTIPANVTIDSIRYYQGKLEYLKTKDNLCHRCNMISPAVRHKHEMYGGVFSKYYGWYIKQQKLRMGVSPDTLRYLDDITPNNVIQMIDDLVESRDKSARLMQLANQMAYDYADTNEEAKREIKWKRKERINNAYDKHQKEHVKSLREYENYFENIVRQEFGFKKIGDAWVSETMMYNIIKKMFPTSNIERHYRPDWLCGLELDVFVPEENLGFEYQGQQHYKPIKVWGGEKALRDLQERDAKKKELCKNNGIRLVEVTYFEPLTIDHIRSKINSAQR